MRISDWSSDVCSSDLGGAVAEALVDVRAAGLLAHGDQAVLAQLGLEFLDRVARRDPHPDPRRLAQHRRVGELHRRARDLVAGDLLRPRLQRRRRIGNDLRSEEHTSELQSLMRISYAVFCLKKKKTNL